jgi:hypothetical protein
MTGVSVIVAAGAASLSGVLTGRDNGQRESVRSRIHLIPAEAGAANDLLRYFETPVDDEGRYSFANLPPGRYLVFVEKVMPSGQSSPAGDRGEQAKKLRDKAETGKIEIELKPCQHVTGFALSHVK